MALKLMEPKSSENVNEKSRSVYSERCIAWRYPPFLAFMGGDHKNNEMLFKHIILYFVLSVCSASWQMNLSMIRALS